MDQVEKSENYQALSIIIGEQQRQMSQVSACDPRAAIESARGGFSIAADQCLSQAVAVLSSPNAVLAVDPVPLLARAAALIAFELARIVRIRRGIAAGEFIAPIFLEEEGSDLTVQAYSVTNPVTGKFAGLTKDRPEAEALLRRLAGSAYGWDLVSSPDPLTVEAPHTLLLPSSGGVS